MIDLGTDFNSAVLVAAGLDPAECDIGTLTIDFLPDTGDVTIRASRVATVSSTTLRELIVQFGGPVVSEESE